MSDPTPTLTAEQREELAEHEPVIGATYVPGRPRGSIVGCSCLNARDYRAAGYRAGQEGWRDHLAEAIARMVAEAEQRGRAEALREAADAWTQGAWSDVMLPKPSPPAVPVIAYSNRMGDWLRTRADRIGGGE